MQKRILIVDDEPSIRKVLRAHLGRAGYDVETAENGRVAQQRLNEVDFHLVVTDLKMPEMGGMELLAWCMDACPGLPVILITAHGTVDSAVEAIKLGAHDYITKPFDQEELRRIIAKALRTEEADRRRFRSPAEQGKYGIIGQTPEMFGVYDPSARSQTAPPPR